MNDQTPFAYPQWAISASQQAGLLKVAGVLAVLSALYAVWFARRERDPYPLFVFIGAGVSVLYEPLGDILTKVAYPPLNQLTLMTALGRPIPLWMLPNYLFFFCVPVLLLLQFVVKPGVSKLRWFLTYAGVTLFVAAFEQPGINSDAWRYYSETQAYSINTYPFWVAFANSQTLYMIAVGVALLRRNGISRQLSFLYIVLVPMLLVGAHVAPNIFVTAAIYSTRNPLIINAAAALSVACCILNVTIGYHLVSGEPSRVPARASRSLILP